MKRIALVALVVCLAACLLFSCDESNPGKKPSGPAPTTGTASITGGGTVGWVQLWENGPKFAAMNLGATSTGENEDKINSTEKMGGLYAFGSSSGYNLRDNTPRVDATVYTTAGALPVENDTATVLWGSNWRMPTTAELTALKDKIEAGDCVATLVNETGKIPGYRISGKVGTAYEENYIFMPIGGYIDGAGLCAASSITRLWASDSEVATTGNVYQLHTDSGLTNKVVTFNKEYSSYENGCSIRPVLNN